MSWIKQAFFYFFCILIPLIFIEMISGYLIASYYPHEKVLLLSRIKSIAVSQILYRKYFYSDLNYVFIGYRFVLENSNFKKIINNESMREVYEKIYDDKPIENIRRDWESYHNQVFSYKLNNVDHLMTVNPQAEKNDGIILIGERGDRKGVQNQSINECWLFGGSTVWGERVHGSETITSYLNQIQNKYVFLNYGVPGYNSNSQLKYFIHLLKSSEVLPKCVVWLDGLNDGSFIWLRPAVKANDRSSHNDRPPSRILNLSKELISYLPQKIIERDKQSMENLSQVQKFDLETFDLINTNLREYLLSNKKMLTGEEAIFHEAAINHLKNARLAKSMLEKSSSNNSKFYWFIQPNGELNKSNPFFLEGHYLSNRYLINRYYQNQLLIKSAGFGINLTEYGLDCKYCYIDEVHYSPAFSKKIALEISKFIK